MDDDRFPARLAVNLLRLCDVQVAQVALQLRIGCLKVKDSLHQADRARFRPARPLTVCECRLFTLSEQRLPLPSHVLSVPRLLDLTGLHCFHRLQRWRLAQKQLHAAQAA